MSPSSAVAPTALVGRDGELRAIDGLLDVLPAGAGGVLVLNGAPGIGKTRLLDELCARAGAAGVAVLRGRAATAQGDVPYDVLAAALEPWLAAHPDAGAAGADVALAIAAFTGTAAVAAAVGDERWRIWRGTRALVERAAADGPVVVALDDVHWADGASVGLIASLLRRPPEGPVLLALAWRDEHDRDLTLQLIEASRETSTTRLAPQPLGSADTARLLPELNPDARAAVVAESGGNPFYAVELGRHWGSEGAARDDARHARQAGVPPAVAAAIHAEIAALPERARVFARGAAIAGDPFSFASAVAAAGVEAADAGRALDALAAAGVVTPVPNDARRFAFRHPIVWRAIHDATPAGWRIEAHARAAAALAAAGAPTRLRAHHLARSAGPGDLEAVAVLSDSAAAVLSQSPASAAEWAAAARDLLPDGDAHRERRVDLLDLEARARMASGDLAGAHAVLSRALDDGPGRPAGPLQQVVYLEMLLGWFDEARARLVDAAATEGDHQWIQYFLTGMDMFRTDVERCVERADALTPPPAPDAPPDWRATAALVYAAGALGRQALSGAGAAAGDHARATALMDDLDPGATDLWAEVAFMLSLADRVLDQEDKAIARLRTMLRSPRPMRQIHVQLRAGTELAMTLAERGDLAEAAQLAETAVETGRMVGSTWLLANALTAQSAVARLAGDVPRALALGLEAQRLPMDRRRPYPGLQRRTLAATFLSADDPDACVAAFDPFSPIDAADLGPGGRGVAHELLTEAHLDRGDHAAARASAAAGRAYAERSGLPRAHMRALRADARVLLGEDDPAAAVTAASAAVACAERAGPELELARSRLLAGQALAAAGRKAEALDALSLAEEAFARLGVGLWRPVAVRELRRLGRRVAAPGEGGAALTARERDVARRVAAGATNQEIADALFLSPRTVETHVRNLFRKLDVRRRGDIAVPDQGRDQ
jgi:DNA-binding CsgD family transcriptional regulator